MYWNGWATFHVLNLEDSRKIVLKYKPLILLETWNLLKTYNYVDNHRSCFFHLLILSFTVSIISYGDVIDSGFILKVNRIVVKCRAVNC